MSGLVTVVHGFVKEPQEPLASDVVWRSISAELRSRPEPPTGSLPLAVVIVTEPLVLYPFA